MAFVMGVGLRLQQLWVYLSAHDNHLVDGHHSFEGLRAPAACRYRPLFHSASSAQVDSHRNLEFQKVSVGHLWIKVCMNTRVSKR